MSDTPNPFTTRELWYLLRRWHRSLSSLGETTVEGITPQCLMTLSNVMDLHDEFTARYGRETELDTLYARWKEVMRHE